MSDLISRQAAINALWKALYEYEDKTEKQFIESDDLDIEDWIQHCIFVQNMSDIDRKTIMELPSAQPEIIKCKDCIYQTESWSGIKYCEAHGDHIGKDYDYCSNARRRDNE